MAKRTLVLLALAALAGSADAKELLPRPAGLEPAVHFWTRIYTEVDTNGGLIHDSREMGVVYEKVTFARGTSERAREKKVERIKRRYRDTLRRLASGKRKRLSAEEKRVLGLWAAASNRTLRDASKRLRFQLGQADKFRAGLIRSRAWRPFITKTLREHGVPVELAALPHVESSFNAKAYSRVGAAGLWQFTRSTGKRFLRIDSVVDERLDTYKATVAAARLLRENHRLTKEWPLAITAYNHGASGMRRAVKRLGTTDIATVVARYRSRTFGFASRNFYTSFLAANAIDQKPEVYFGKLPYMEPFETRVLELPHYYAPHSLAEAIGIDIATLRDHNPALRPAVWNGGKYMPKGFGLRLPSNLLAQEPERVFASIPKEQRISAQPRDRYHKVRRGETLSQIAGRYRVSQRELMALNNLRSRHRIRTGQVLVLPDAAGARSARVATLSPPTNGLYKVRRGDTIAHIARRFGVPEMNLIEANQLRNPNRIAVGKQLRIPGAGPEPTAIAAAAPVQDARSQGAPPAEAARGADARESAAETVAEPAAEARDSARAPESAAVAEPDDTPIEPPARRDRPKKELVTPPASVPAEVMVVDAAPGEDAGATPDALVDPTGEPPPSQTAAPKAPALDRPVPDPSDYTVHRGNRITVQADETLGHYAEWLEIRASQLRSLNRMRYGKDIVIGRAIKLDFSRVSPAEFEQRRLGYHRTLQEAFFDAYAVTGTEKHRLKGGDTLWYLARRKYRVPVWLLRQYNPDLDFGALPSGATMVVPRIQSRQAG